MERRKKTHEVTNFLFFVITLQIGVLYWLKTKTLTMTSFGYFDYLLFGLDMTFGVVDKR